MTFMENIQTTITLDFHFRVFIPISKSSFEKSATKRKVDTSLLSFVAMICITISEQKVRKAPHCYVRSVMFDTYMVGAGSQ